MLPKSFNSDGFLSEDYDVTFAEMRESLLVQGPEPLPPSWDSVRRRWLVDNLEIYPMAQEWPIGVFVEDRIIPFPEGFRLVKNSNKRKGIVILKKGLGD